MAEECRAREKVVEECLRDPGGWKGRVGYGMRWMAESVFSSLKRSFGEHVTARRFPEHGQGDDLQGSPLQPLHQPKPLNA
jgi:hypothetical protein